MPSFDPLTAEFYRRPAEAVARDLLGRWIVRQLLGQHASAQETVAERLVLRIVEAEAYLGECDRASHAHAGPVTPRARRLYRQPGCAYVYLIYGMHHCLNAVTGSADDGSAVLIRAGEPLEGAERMLALRGWQRTPRAGDAAGGPGKLCQALAIDRAFDGVPLWAGELRLTEGEPVGDSEVACGRRVGVDYAGDAASWPLRFAVRDNPHVSRPDVRR